MSITYTDIVNVLYNNVKICDDVIDMIALKTYEKPRHFEIGASYGICNRGSRQLSIKVYNLTKHYVDFFVYRRGRIVGCRTRSKKRTDVYGSEWFKSDRWLIDKLKA